MNLSALQDITPPNISISGSNIFSNIVSEANSITNDYLIFGVMMVILIVVYMILSDKTPLQEFGYDDFRALNLALSSCVLIGLNMISVGWSTNFFAVGMFSSLWMVTLIGILIYENKE